MFSTKIFRRCKSWYFHCQGSYNAHIGLHCVTANNDVHDIVDLQQ